MFISVVSLSNNNNYYDLSTLWPLVLQCTNNYVDIYVGSDEIEFKYM